MRSQVVLGCWLVLSTSLFSQEVTLGLEVETSNLIPQHFLGLMHAPEVHQELKLTKAQVADLEKVFQKIDGDWFRARNLGEEQQRKIISQLENVVWQWITKNLDSERQTRAKQLELRAQAVRMLFRPDVASRLKLDEQQLSSLAALAKATISANKELAEATVKGQATEELKKKLQTASREEQNALQSSLNQSQLQELSKLIGDPFDPATLTRIYPMAPELVAVENWINSKPLKLSELRGKVVVIHFYAFQCINCQRNLPHYSKWSKEFNDADVVVIGIQTPETESEHNVSKIRDAAKQAGINYPVLVDLERKNWDTWSNTMWPTVYVIDRQGYLRRWWQGELNWQGGNGEEQFHDLIQQLVDAPS